MNTREESSVLNTAPFWTLSLLEVHLTAATGSQFQTCLRQVRFFLLHNLECFASLTASPIHIPARLNQVNHLAQASASGQDKLLACVPISM